MDKCAFGSFIAQARRDAGMTQQMLADRLHVTDKAVSKWERGLCFPDLTLIEPLAAELARRGASPVVICESAGTQAEDAAAMREERDHPGSHPDLVVRVCGYSAPFAGLPREIQDEVIARTAG